MDNGSYTFDEEGNPIPAEKPPRAPRSSRSKSKTSVTSSTSKSGHQNAPAAVASFVPAEGGTGTGTESNEDTLTDMFHMDGQGFDVTVSFLLGQVHWEPMNPNGESAVHSVTLTEHNQLCIE